MISSLSTCLCDTLEWSVFLSFACAKVNLDEIVNPVFNFYFVENASNSQIIRTYKGRPINKNIVFLLAIDLGYLHFVNKMTLMGRDLNGLDLEIEYYDRLNKMNSPCKRSIESYARATFICNSLGRVLRILGNFTLIKLTLSGYNTFYEASIGCFEINAHVIPHHSPDFLESCFQMCLFRKKKFTAINQGVGDKCLCLDNLLSSRSVDLYLCDRSCKNIAFQSCGGASYYMVYSRSPLLSRRQTSNDFDCFYSGDCPKCAAGRAGYNCDSFDCRVNNGNCESLNCQQWFSKYHRSICKCKKGSTLSSDNICIDVDECQFVFLCNETTSVCKNVPNSYLCDCRKGFKKSGWGACEDINECYQNDPCHVLDAQCYNSFGSYTCVCRPGYVVNSRKICEDDNECQAGVSRPCGEAECQNLQGSYRCICQHGYGLSKGFGTIVCSDIDECLEQICPDEAPICINVFGSYKCLCRDGINFLDREDCPTINATPKAAHSFNISQSTSSPKDGDLVLATSVLVAANIILYFSLAVFIIAEGVFRKFPDRDSSPRS